MISEFGMDMYTLLYLKWITTRTYCIAQRTLLNVCSSLDGRGVWGRINICICMVEFLFCPPEIITTLIELTVLQSRIKS